MQRVQRMLERRRKTWMCRTANHYLELAGLRKKRIVETPWARTDSSHARVAQSKSLSSRVYSLLPQNLQHSITEARRAAAHMPKTVSQPESLDAMMKGLGEQMMDTAKSVDHRISKELDKRVAPRGERDPGSNEMYERVQESQRTIGRLLSPAMNVPRDVIQLVETSSDRTLRMRLPLASATFLSKLVRTHRPSMALDCGSGFALYTACLMSDAMDDQHIHIVSVECHDATANTAKTLAQNLRPRTITAVWCYVHEYLNKLPKQIQFDFVMMDHDPRWFQQDLDLLLGGKRLIKNAIIAARIDFRGTGAADTTEFMYRASKHKLLKPLHGPPNSPLFVCQYIGS